VIFFSFIFHSIFVCLFCLFKFRAMKLFLLFYCFLTLLLSFFLYLRHAHVSMCADNEKRIMRKDIEKTNFLFYWNWRLRLIWFLLVKEEKNPMQFNKKIFHFLHFKLFHFHQLLMKRNFNMHRFLFYSLPGGKILYKFLLFIQSAFSPVHIILAHMYTQFE
jgi:hypothetical protein